MDTNKEKTMVVGVLGDTPVEETTPDTPAEETKTTESETK